MSDLHAPQDDPTGDATQKLSSYLTVALAAAQAAVQRATLRTQRQARDAQPDALELGQARARWAPLLGPDARRVDAPTALAAWTAAQPYRESLAEAERAAVRAEERLRDLHPAAMARYEALRRGLPAEDAMREVTPLLLAKPDAAPVEAQATTGLPLPTSSTEPGKGDGEDLSARYAPVVRDALPAELADQVLAERAWPRLAAALHTAEQAGADPAELLQAAAEQRELGTAKSPAQVLAHRLAARTPADTAAASYPAPLAPTRAGPAAGEEGSLAAAGRRLEQSADRELAAAHAADRTPDDPTTLEVDEHREGLGTGHAHSRSADELHAQAQQLHSEASTSGSGGPERPTPAVTAARSYSAPPSAAAPPPRHAPTSPPPTVGLPVATRSR